MKKFLIVLALGTLTVHAQPRSDATVDEIVNALTPDCDKKLTTEAARLVDKASL